MHNKVVTLLKMLFNVLNFSKYGNKGIAQETVSNREKKNICPL